VRRKILNADRQFDFGARSDKGRVRENNEDSFRVAPELDLFVLSDGMGGQASGEVASRIAAEAVVDYCRAAGREPSKSATNAGGLSVASGILGNAVRRANSAIREAAATKPEWHGMGATVVAVRFECDRLSLAHVGDSRVYRLRSGELEQLTCDHSFVAEQVRRGLLTPQEADQSQLQNVLLRALGAEPEVDVELDEELLLDGDTILLCSDGLTRELPDKKIAAVLEDAEDAQAAVDRLIDLANQAGGEDNITAIVLRRAEKPVGAFARIGRWLKGSEESS
jgi:PPM family protein phosphatase